MSQKQVKGPRHYASRPHEEYVKDGKWWYQNTAYEKPKGKPKAKDKAKKSLLEKPLRKKRWVEDLDEYGMDRDVMGESYRELAEMYGAHVPEIPEGSDDPEEREGSDGGSGSGGWDELPGQSLSFAKRTPRRKGKGKVGKRKSSAKTNRGWVDAAPVNDVFGGEEMNAVAPVCNLFNVLASRAESPEAKYEGPSDFRREMLRDVAEQLRKSHRDRYGEDLPMPGVGTGDLPEPVGENEEQTFLFIDQNGKPAVGCYRTATNALGEKRKVIVTSNLGEQGWTGDRLEENSGYETSGNGVTGYARGLYESSLPVLEPDPFERDALEFLCTQAMPMGKSQRRSRERQQSESLSGILSLGAAAERYPEMAWEIGDDKEREGIMGTAQSLSDSIKRAGGGAEYTKKTIGAQVDHSKEVALNRLRTRGAGEFTSCPPAQQAFEAALAGEKITPEMVKGIHNHRGGWKFGRKKSLSSPANQEYKFGLTRADVAFPRHRRLGERSKKRGVDRFLVKGAFDPPEPGHPMRINKSSDD